jgi:hypothetical protein
MYMYTYIYIYIMNEVFGESIEINDKNKGYLITLSSFGMYLYVHI